MLLKLTSMVFFILGLANLLYFFFCGRVLQARLLFSMGALATLNFCVYSTLGACVLYRFNQLIPFMLLFIP